MRSKAALKYAATKLHDKVSKFNFEEKLKKLNNILKRSQLGNPRPPKKWHNFINQKQIFAFDKSLKLILTFFYYLNPGFYVIFCLLRVS